MFEPQIGEIITVENVKYITELTVNPEPQCNQCHLRNKPCMGIACTPFTRKDGQAVIFKEVKEMEVKIQIPDNCELIKDGDTYLVKEKKQTPPRSWEEFCERYPLKEEAFIDSYSNIKDVVLDKKREKTTGKNWCTSKEEAEAFLALMQLRQLRKAWVGEWEPSHKVEYSTILVEKRTNMFKVDYGYWEYNYSMTFPSKGMADDFLYCFKDLCEIAKPLL